MAIGRPGDGGLGLLLLDQAIERDAESRRARKGALITSLIQPLELTLGDHDGDGLDESEHSRKPMRRQQTTSVDLPLGG